MDWRGKDGSLVLRLVGSSGSVVGSGGVVSSGLGGVGAAGASDLGASLKINLRITNEIRLDIFDQVMQADWEAYAPDLTVARLQAEAAGDDVKVSRREALPRLGLGYKATYGEGSYNNGLTAGLSIPLFSNRHNVKRAQAYERAARAEAEAAVVEKRNTVNELYAKADYAARLLQSFDIMPDADSYVGVLVRLLESGQMNIIDYYSELDTLYQTLETRIRIEMEYRLGVARLLVIYL